MIYHIIYMYIFCNLIVISYIKNLSDLFLKEDLLLKKYLNIYSIILERYILVLILIYLFILLLK